MSGSKLQAWIDELHETSGQQWALRLIIVLAPLGAIAAAALEAGTWWPVGMAGVGALAIASAFRPDSHVALTAVVIVAWHWLAVVDAVDTPWLPVAACCLFVYHSLVALTASFPVGGIVPTPTLFRWLQRGALCVGATVAMWVLTALMDQREAAGNGLLTAGALVIVALGAIAAMGRSPDETA